MGEGGDMSEVVTTEPEAVLCLPGGGKRYTELIDAFSRKYKDLVIEVALGESEPNLYLRSENRFHFGVPVLRALAR